MGTCFWCNKSLVKEYLVVGDVLNFCCRKCVKEWEIRTSNQEQSRIIRNLKFQRQQQVKANKIAQKKADKNRKRRQQQRKRQESEQRRRKNIQKEKEAVKKVAKTTATIGAATVIVGAAAAIAAKNKYDKNKQNGSGCGCSTLFILSTPGLLYSPKFIEWILTV